MDQLRRLQDDGAVQPPAAVDVSVRLSGSEPLIVTARPVLVRQMSQIGGFCERVERRKGNEAEVCDPSKCLANPALYIPRNPFPKADPSYLFLSDMAQGQ